jgi:hypothetical protein
MAQLFGTITLTMIDKKRKQLGVPIGTASHRLRKLILFSLVQELARDICYRCSSVIQDADDLGIDHKEPWLDISVERFWDLGNIAFSHTRCNIIHRRTTFGKTLGANSIRKEGPPGMAWCSTHRDFLPLAGFSRNRATWNGLQYECRQCRSQRRRRSRRREMPQLLFDCTMND